MSFLTRELSNPRKGATYNVSRKLVVVDCPTCGLTYAIPDSLDEWLLQYNSAAYPQNVGSVHCPAGHEWHYTGLNEEQELRRKLDAERQRSGRIAAERDQIEASRRAQKAATTRARKRHANGVCPACKRTFQNVQRHMDSQHPDYDPTKGHHEGS